MNHIELGRIGDPLMAISIHDGVKVTVCKPLSMAVWEPVDRAILKA